MNTFTENQFVLKTNGIRPEVVQIINVYEEDMCEVYNKEGKKIAVSFENLTTFDSPVKEIAEKLTARLKPLEKFMTKQMNEINIRFLQKHVNENYFQEQSKEATQMMEELDLYTQKIQQSFVSLFDVDHKKEIANDETTWLYSFKNKEKEFFLTINMGRYMNDVFIKIEVTENSSKSIFASRDQLLPSDLDGNKEKIEEKVKELFQQLYDPSLLD